MNISVTCDTLMRICIFGFSVLHLISAPIGACVFGLVTNIKFEVTVDADIDRVINEMRETVSAAVHEAAQLGYEMLLEDRVDYAAIRAKAEMILAMARFTDDIKIIALGIIRFTEAQLLGSEVTIADLYLLGQQEAESIQSAIDDPVQLAWRTANTNATVAPGRRIHAVTLGAVSGFRVPASQAPVSDPIFNRIRNFLPTLRTILYFSI